MSASSLNVSTAGPLKRNGSTRLPPSAPAACTCSVRERESELYCSEITLRTRPLSALINTRPPLSSFGDPLKPVITSPYGTFESSHLPTPLSAGPRPQVPLRSPEELTVQTPLPVPPGSLQSKFTIATTAFVAASTLKIRRPSSVPSTVFPLLPG